MLYRVTNEGHRVAGWSSPAPSVLRNVSNGEFVVDPSSVGVSRDSCGTIGDGPDSWVKVEARGEWIRWAPRQDIANVLLLASLMLGP